VLETSGLLVERGEGACEEVAREAKGNVQRRGAGAEFGGRLRERLGEGGEKDRLLLRL